MTIVAETCTYVVGVDAHSAARSVLAHPTDALRNARRGDVGHILQILVTARDHVTRNSTATKNALTALTPGHELGIDARKPLTLRPDRRVAHPPHRQRGHGGRPRRSNPLGHDHL